MFNIFNLTELDNQIVLIDITVKTVAAIAVGDIAATKISEIHLKNVGQAQNGVSLAQAARMVLNELYENIIVPGVLGTLKNQLRGLGEELDGVRKEIKSLGGRLKRLIDN